MPTTNSRKATTFKGEQYLVFERDSKVSYNDSGKDRDDTSATVSFTPVHDNGIEVDFNYVSYQAEKSFGRELSLDLSQVIQLKRFLDEHLERVLSKSKHTFVFLVGEHLKDEFVSENFTDYEFVCLARIPDKRLAKYRDKDYPDMVGLSFSVTV